MKNKKWYIVNNTENIISPSLLVYPKRVEENIQTMIRIAGGTEFLRPHIKTYKIAEIIQLQLESGISKFKCATIAEAQLLAQCGVKDILLAIQPVGTNIGRFFTLIARYPESKFSTIVDNRKTINEIAKIASTKNSIVPLWLDINNGMNRTGIWPGKAAHELYMLIDSNLNLSAQGLHVYDGHIREPDFNLRKKECDEAFNLVLKLKNEIENSGIKIKRIIAGGTPSFPIHALRENVEVSPGTPLLWDQGYANLLQELPFLPAAVLFSRIISKPKANFICFDLGHKSVASEMQFPRVNILGYDKCEQVSHSEEHLVVESMESEKHAIGDVCYAIPVHICPTVSKYAQVVTVVEGKVTSSWKVAARDHKMNI